ncbi:amidase [Haladaptatus sp. GCM10025707]|uniref:amidase n=1 Tax=unclassified Haladaptatus TaxID=2622732 RepID=UPI0023E81AF7|nr:MULTISPECIES: amidase [unclassified Haladaptatus]
MTETDLELMRTQAARFDFALADEILADLVTAALAEADLADDRAPPAGTDRGHSSADDENAMLAVYDEPRLETPDGPLAGLTVAVKDNIAVADLEMTCGSASYSVIPSFDATVIERLLAAGAVLVGKTNMEPFAMGPTGEFSDFGHVTNPTAPDHVAGGSSSGSGAAVAAGTVDVALGSDTGGSIRIPAACCGVVGAKPSHRLVPRYGFVDFAPSLDTIGPLTRDVRTAARALEAMAGPDPRDPTCARATLEGVGDTVADFEGLTVGLPDTGFDRADDAVADAVREVASRLDAVGVETTPVSLDLNLEVTYLNIGSAEFSWLLAGDGVVRGFGSGYSEQLRAAFEAARERGLGDHVARRILPPAFLDAKTNGRAYAKARRAGIDFGERLTATFADVDALVMPTLRTLPPAVGETTTRADLLPLIGNTAPFNIAGTPAVSVPVETVDGRPVCAQAVAPQFDDATALRVAAALEQVAN